MFKPYYDIRGKIGAKDLLPLTSASTLANKVLDMGLIDMMMFSINAACEAIQVAAMCRKFMGMEGKR